HEVGGHNERAWAIIRSAGGLCPLTLRRPLSRWLRHSGLHLRSRHREVESRTRSFFALDPDCAAVTVDDLARDVQTETKAAVVRGGNLASAMEPFEDLRQLVGWNSDSFIADGGDD